jgi:hypothetical protein
LSDFHEMVTHLRMQEERSLLMENHATICGKAGYQSGIETRQFSYSDCLPEKRDHIDLRILPLRKINTKPGA